MIDSAQAYNEEHVGFALEKSGIPREDIVIVSKVHPRFLGYQETLQSVEESLKNLKVKSFYQPCLAQWNLHWSNSYYCSQWRGKWIGTKTVNGGGYDNLSFCSY